MQSHKNALLTRGGEVVPGASVYVYNAGTVTAATIYSDNGTTSITQPIITNQDGEYEFWAADGVYDVHITYSNATEDYEIILFDPIRGGSSVDISIGPTATPALFLDVSANQLQIGKNQSTAFVSLELGTGRTGNGGAFIDLIGDPTYPDYGLRIWRNASGANTTSDILHRGIGNLNITAFDAGSVVLKTNNTTALSVLSNQDVTIGTTCALFDVSANQLQVGRNLTTETTSIELGVGRTGNGISSIHLIGDTTYPIYGLLFERGATGANTDSRISHRGNGALNLVAFDAGSVVLKTNNTTALTVDASQKVGIGIGTPDTNLHVWNGSAGTVSAFANTLLTLENSTHAYINILTPNTFTQAIKFGDPEDTDAGQVAYNHSGDTLQLWAGANQAVSLDKPVTASYTAMQVYDVDNAGLQRVTVGAADSGGAGYKVLRIPN